MNVEGVNSSSGSAGQSDSLKSLSGNRISFNASTSGNQPDISVDATLAPMGNSLPETALSDTSEEDYDRRTPEQVLLERNNDVPGAGVTGRGTMSGEAVTQRLGHAQPGLAQLQRKITSKGYVLSADEKELVRRRVQGVESEMARGGQFRDLVFTRKFSTFDRQNADAANSPFHGFFTLFWMVVLIFMVKIGAENWQKHGSPLGTNEIIRAMFKRDLLVLLMSDGAMCGLTGVSWLLQKAVVAGYINWDRSGWVIQNIWQTGFIGSVVGLTLLRDWEWPATVFFVMHGLVMVMKQHSVRSIPCA